MIGTLLAAALFAALPSDVPEGITAARMRDGCVTSLSPGPPPRLDADAAMASAYCELLIAIELTAAAVDAVGTGPGATPVARQVCLPQGVSGDEGSTLLARTFIAYVDAHPEVRDADGAEIFSRALAEKWPCPR